MERDAYTGSIFMYVRYISERTVHIHDHSLLGECKSMEHKTGDVERDSTERRRNNCETKRERQRERERISTCTVIPLQRSFALDHDVSCHCRPLKYAIYNRLTVIRISVSLSPPLPAAVPAAPAKSVPEVLIEFNALCKLTI